MENEHPSPEAPEVQSGEGAAPGAVPSATPAGETAPAADDEAVVADLEQLTARARERDEFLALAQRTQADFENFRKRASREQGLAEARGVAKVVRELLPALDNLERALQAAESRPDHSEDHLAEGLRLVQAEMAAALTRVGVEGYAPKGEVFDPNVHEAMAQQPVEGAESGTVVEVYQVGYQINGTVIRPARVVVAA